MYEPTVNGTVTSGITLDLVVEVQGRFERASIDATGHLLLWNGREIVMVRDGEVERSARSSDTHEIRAAALSPAGRRAVLEVERGGSGALRVDDLPTPRATAVLARLALDVVTLDLCWAAEEHVWLAGTDAESGDARLSLVHVSDDRVVASTQFAVPFADDELRFATADANGCSFNMHAGQHGSCAYAATRRDGSVSVALWIDGAGGQLETAEGEVLALIERGLTRVGRAPALDLSAHGWPLDLVQADPGRVVVGFDQGDSLVLVDSVGMRALEVVQLPSPRPVRAVTKLVAHPGGGFVAVATGGTLSKPSTSVYRGRAIDAGARGTGAAR